MILLDWPVKYYRVMYNFILSILLKKQMLNFIVHNFVSEEIVRCHQSWDGSEILLV